MVRNNYLIKQFMKETGLKFDETFEAVLNNKYKDKAILYFTLLNDEITIMNGCINEGEWKNISASELLYEVIFSDRVTIYAHPFKPENGESYYKIATDGECYKSTFAKSCCMADYLIGNCFRNKSEAEANKKIIMKILNRDEPLIKLINISIFCRC